MSGVNILGNVTPREGRVSRNDTVTAVFKILKRHAPRGACE